MPARTSRQALPANCPSSRQRNRSPTDQVRCRGGDEPCDFCGAGPSGGLKTRGPAPPSFPNTSQIRFSWEESSRESVRIRPAPEDCWKDPVVESTRGTRTISIASPPPSRITAPICVVMADDRSQFPLRIWIVLL